MACAVGCATICAIGRAHGSARARIHECLGPHERGQSTTDQQLIPAGTVLLHEEYRLSSRADSRARARCLDFHQRSETVNFGFGRHELGQDARQTQRLVAQCGPHPILAGGRGIAFVEDQIEDFEHG